MQILWEHERHIGGLYNFTDCGDAALKHWLYCQDIMLADLGHIKHKVLFHFETFAFGDTQGLRCDGLSWRMNRWFQGTSMRCSGNSASPLASRYTRLSATRIRRTNRGREGNSTAIVHNRCWTLRC